MGVVITEDCMFSQQCAAAATKDINKLRVIKRTFKYYDKEHFTILYKAHVRPDLVYCIQARNPSLSKIIKLLERVERRATKLVQSLRNKSYEERLEELNLYTLEE